MLNAYCAIPAPTNPNAHRATALNCHRAEIDFPQEEAGMGSRVINVRGRNPATDGGWVRADRTGAPS